MTNNGELWSNYYRVNTVEDYQVPSVVFSNSFIEDMKDFTDPALFPFTEGNKLIHGNDVKLEPNYVEVKGEETVLGRMIVPVTVVLGDKVLTYKSGEVVFDVAEVIPDNLIAQNAPNTDYAITCISNFIKNIFLEVEDKVIGMNSALFHFGVYTIANKKEAGYYFIVSIGQALLDVVLPEEYEWVEDKELIGSLNDLAIIFDK